MVSSSNKSKTGDRSAEIWIDMSKVRLADGRLELCQLSRLLQLIRRRDFDAIANLVAKGVPSIIDYVHPASTDPLTLGGGQTTLGLAADFNDEEMLEFLLGLGANPSVYDLKGRTAAMIAATSGNVQAMKVLAQGGVDMKVVDEAGQGVLFYCMGPTRRHAQCAQIALEHGADVNNRTRQGTPILLFACETATNNEEFCLLLLNHGADPRIGDEESNRTPVMAAASSGSAFVVNALLSKQNNVDEVMDRIRLHALHEAAKNGHFEVIKTIAGFGANFDQTTDKAYSTAETPIHMAAANGHDDSIIFLASRGTNAIGKNKDGKTAKMIAKELGNKAVLKACKKAEKITKAKSKPPLWLIRLHDFCFINDQQITAAMLQHDQDGKRMITHEDFMATLREFGAPLPAESDPVWKEKIEAHKVGKHFIQYSVFLGGRKLLPKKFLMSAFVPKYKKPKSLKAIRVKGWPMPISTLPPDEAIDAVVPLHEDVTDLDRFDRDRPPTHQLADDTAWYCRRPTPTTIDLNLAVRHLDRYTVLDATHIQTMTVDGAAYVPVNPEPPQLLPLAAGKPGTAASAEASTALPPKSADTWQVPVLGDQAQVNLRDRLYKTPLMVAAAMGNLDMVELLVKAGANVNAKDQMLWTPLHHAALSGIKPVVEYLLQHGAKLQTPSINGATPLMTALGSSNVEIVQYLIDRGAKVRAENRCEMTPLDIAACYASYEVWNIVKTKEDSLPPVKDNAKKKKKKKPGKKKQDPLLVNQHPTPQRPIDKLQPLPVHYQSRALAQTMASINADNNIVEDITYRPNQVWTRLLTSDELIAERQQRRLLRGWKVDFDDLYRTPFQQNILNKLGKISAEDEALAEYKRKTGKRK